MYHMAGTFPKCDHSFLEGFFHGASQLLHPADTTAKFTVNPAFQLMYHVSGSCYNFHTFLIGLPGITVRNKQYNTVSHNGSYQTFKKSLSDFPECGIKFVSLHTGPHRIGKNTIFRRIPEFSHDHISVFFPDIQKLPVIILICLKIILQKNIIDISALDHRHNRLQLFTDTEIVASLLSCGIYLFHSFGACFQNHLFVYRLGKKFHNSKIYRFLGIIKFIIGCNDHKDHRPVKFLNFPDCLDST